MIWDGFVDESKKVDGMLPTRLAICLDNGESELVNADAPNGYAAPHLATDAHRCTLDKLPAVDLPLAGD